MSNEILDLFKGLTATAFPKKANANPSAPDLKIKVSTKEGKINVMDMGIWKKKSKDGSTYYSINFSEPYVQEAKGHQIESNNVPDEDIPF